MSTTVAQPNVPTSYDQFSRLVESDVRNKAAAADAQWLRRTDNLVNWLRELTFVRNSVQNSLNFLTNEKREHPLNPANAGGNSDEWKEISDSIKSRRTRAIKFLSYVENRIKEASFLIAESDVVEFDDIEVLVRLQKVENLLINGDAEAALASIASLIDRLGGDSEDS
jgi:hypothetical protein